MAEIIKRKKINSSVEASPQGSRFVSRANWTRTDYDCEWSNWNRDGLALLAAGGRGFTDGEYRILNVVVATARRAEAQNNMLGLRDALARYLAIARKMLGLNGHNKGSDAA